MAEPQIYSLTPEEVEIMQASESNPNIFFAYWFEKPGVRPFQLDYGFEGETKWQVQFCMALQSMLVAVCGIATGKTLCAGMSAFYHACITPYFRFMNVGHELLQAKYMYDEIIRFAQDTRAMKLIKKYPASPHPQIVIEYMIGEVKVSSELVFMSAGEKSDAMNIFSWRGDWINIEEAGRFANLGDVVSRLTTRLTGATAAGRPYMGRMSLISNPIDNPELWTIFDKAVNDPEALTFMIDTKDNKSVTDKQLRLQLSNIPAEEQQFYLSGVRPDGRGAYFNRNTVEKCAQESLSVLLREGLASGVPGWVGHYYPALGYWHFEFPWNPDHQYMIIGDPGTGAAPLRNAPSIKVIDTTMAPKLNVIRALWWGNGHGKIYPFITTYLELMKKYRPVFAGIDSTSNQKNFAEVINMEYVVGGGYSVEKITGMDFSGGRRYQYLVSARVSLESGAWAWPDAATGIGTQLKSYDPVEDSSHTSKLAQDLVSTLAMASFASRALYPPTPEPPDGESDKNKANGRKSHRGNAQGRTAHILRHASGR